MGLYRPDVAVYTLMGRVDSMCGHGSSDRERTASLAHRPPLGASIGRRPRQHGSARLAP
jgi:hypothetical protein